MAEECLIKKIFNELLPCKSALVICLLLSVAACSNGYAPVFDRSLRVSKDNLIGLKASTVKSQRLQKDAPYSYKVKAGDTLYSIAWRYGLDFRQLAKRNDIANDYLIYKGQILRVKPQATEPSSATNKPSINRLNKEPHNSDVGKKLPPPINNKVLPKKVKVVVNKPLYKPKMSPNTKRSNTLSNVRWVWPLNGKKYTKYSSKNKGIDFSAEKGEQVLAAASGKVVYAGNGIIGYGNLIIIKHSEEYLSAYAHNSVIFVKENEKIKAGEKIAETGNSGTIKTKLHFEIRKGGKPVNPIKYLPKK